MSYTKETFARAVDDVLSRDPALAKELQKPSTEGKLLAGAERLRAGLESVAEDAGTLSLQAYRYSVVRPVVNVYAAEDEDAGAAEDVGPGVRVRPVVDVQKHRIRTVRCDAESRTWKRRLTAAGEYLLRAIDATGRIEMKGSGDTTVAGTGFMIRKDVIVTNQHVADQFARKSAAGPFVFRLNLGGERMSARIDFLEEIGVNESLEFQIDEILHLEMDVDPDLAFLRVKPNPNGPPLPEPLEFFTGEIEPDLQVAAIGYPKDEIRDPATTALIRQTFGNIFDKKRVSPGQIRAVKGGFVEHDCSVLAGNSGSPIISLKTGKVVGIHAEGEFLDKRFAVPSAAVQASLAAMLARLGKEPPPPDGDGAAQTLKTPRAVKRAKSARQPVRAVAHSKRSRRRSA